MPLTNNQKLANEKFFDKTHSMLNQGGIWKGDDGIMKKVGDKWFADFETYNTIKKLVSNDWLIKNVVLFTDMTNNMD